MPDKPKVTVIPAKPQLLFRKVGIYCRVSTRSQEQLDSLANQVSFLTRLVSYRLDWRLVDTYLDVGSGSKSENRNEFQRILRDCGSKNLISCLQKASAALAGIPSKHLGQSISCEAMELK